MEASRETSGRSTSATPGDILRTCYDEACSSGAYHLLPLGDDIRFDVASRTMTGEDFIVRTTVTGVDLAVIDKPLASVFGDGNHYRLRMDKDDNVSNVFTGGVDCNSLSFPDWKSIVCGPHVVEINDFGSQHPSCPRGDFLIGRAASTTMPHDNCAGWPTTVTRSGITYFPPVFRVWTR